MKYELFDFQKSAVNDLLKKMDSMQQSYASDGSVSAVSLTAPTGAGKTVIASAVAEGLFYSNNTYAGDDRAVILWLSDSPSLNEQTMKRFKAASDLLTGATVMEAIGPDFANSHIKLMPGRIYFLNRQLLSVKGKLTNASEGGRTFYDVLTDTISDPDIHLYLFIDEAHRGLGKDATKESTNKTIYAKLIDGQDGINPPMPCVVGISATPERFNTAMQGRKNRDIKASVDVPVSSVRTSGLIKDTIELRTPKKTADTKHQDLTHACVKLAESSNAWKDYCTDKGIRPVVTPLMVVQVEDKVTKDTLTSLCAHIHKILPWLDISDCFANVFGEHEDIVTPAGKIPYVSPEDVAERTEIRVLFAKDAVSTGWDCPRAEVIYSRRKRTDPTYIAQLIGRMIRTPLARRIDLVEELNTVACYLPEYDAVTVEGVVQKLKEDNVAVATTTILKNPADVSFFGNTKKKIEQKLEKKHQQSSTGTATPTQTEPADNPSVNIPEAPTTQESAQETVAETEFAVNTEPADNPSVNIPEAPTTQESAQETVAETEFAVNTEDEEFYVADIEDDTETEEELTAALERIPKVNSEDIKVCFEGIITRRVRHDKPNNFLDLWDCVDVITSDIDSDYDTSSQIDEDFYNNVEGEIKRHPAAYKRAYTDISNTIVIVKRIDPLTGEEFEDREELVQNDADRLVSYYRRAVNVFAGASDLVKYYINRRQNEEFDSDVEAISRISAVGACIEIIQGLEVWAENKTNELLSNYGPQRYAVSEENKEKWDRIEGNTKPYIERNLNIQASITRQNKDYDAYPKHIISDEDGWAYLNLNDLEKKVVQTELSRSLNVAWYRNQSRNLNAALSIPYMLNGVWENMYPDFIFFQKLNHGSIVPAVVDPHGDWLGDSVAKLQGYVTYLRDHPDMFGSVQVVADKKGGEIRYLDLMLPTVQKAIETFAGTSAKELFTGPLSKVYKVTAE
ncbi:DEAD/DEAH box helicase family protein [Bacillus sp. ISL-18]|uniref:DEAD/DEAH box helicase n=1 Tax=Bacillus sp. ISL-18 TaxID=2819118 RepID=UPI001BE854DE|nr:DEAD/DEAH box helicase family protein [Bacillus sp. ISL-18]MBT2657455.1 DEAD/DEAH box helicase family protein [Bacillus sp. ISL-18]